MAAGIVIGRLFKIGNVQKIVTVVTWLLLFLIGWETGGNENVINALPSIGMNALALSLAGVAGSSALAWALWRNMEIGNNPEGQPSGEDCRASNNQAVKKGLIESLIILAFFVTGICLGLTGTTLGDGIVSRLSLWTLCILILFIGMSIGGNPELASSIKKMNPKLALLPFATIFGTYIGCIIADVFIGYKISDVLAIGSGFGYYSLSSVLISKSLGLKFGAIALISNIIREVFTLLCSPLLVKIAGPLAPIAAGGATTADTTLPIIRNSSGEEYVLLSIFHGFLVDFSVPFLVTFFCAL